MKYTHLVRVFSFSSVQTLKRLILGGMILFGIGFSNAQEMQKPNIILILTDDLGIGDISCYYGRYKTPNIDKIAKQGVRFTKYYSASPICSPSRAAILTGQAPAKLNFTTFLNTREDNKRKDQADYLNANIPTIAKILKKSGYMTAHFGKWHMGGGRDVIDAPNIDQYGFDAWSSTYESPDPDPAITATDWIWSDQDSIKRWNRTAYFVDKTLAFLKENSKKPCYVNLWTDDVHTPWIVGDNELEDTPRKPQSEKSFESVLTEFDEQLGRLMDGLVELGIDEHTIVIFTSDNGPLPNFRQERSAGLRGSKLSLYEGGINMPFIVRWPARIKANRVDSTSVISALDLLPSFAYLAGADLNNTEIFDGEERTDTWLNEPSARSKALFWEYGRNNDYFSFPKGTNRSPALAYREGSWKFLMDLDKNNIELYDLSTDEMESQNMASTHPDLVEKFSEILIKWWSGLPVLEK